MIRFSIDVQPKDGSRHYNLTADLDLPLVPAVGDSILIYGGVTTRISGVTIAPTQDPAVYVRGRSLFPVDEAEAKELVGSAKSEEGWFVR